MSVGTLHRLADLIEVERETLLEEWRRQVMELPAAQDLDAPTLIDHIPLLLEELSAALRSRSDESIPEMLVNGSPPQHGQQRLNAGFNIEEVVAEYNILRGAIYDLAESKGVAIRGATFHILNRVLDEAIGLAVQTFATERALEVKQRREEYLAFLAHDLRTPLNAISLSTHTLKLYLGDISENRDVAQVLTILERNAQQMAALVEKVLHENAGAIGDKLDRIERRRIDMWPVVQSVIHDLQPIAETNGAELSNEVPVELEAFADAGMLMRILQNLVANAVRYSPRGRVTVGARANGGDGAIECWVVDNGKGISPDMLGRVFEKYESDSKDDGRAGLGLAIVKEFVEAHGGTVQVESEQEVQTTFRFHLPGERQRPS